MRKKILFCFFILFAVFVNVNNVKAANSCTCYYSGYMMSEDNGSSYQTNYLVAITLNRSDFDKVNNKLDYRPKFTFFGENGFNTVSGNSGTIRNETSQAAWIDTDFLERLFGHYYGVGLTGNQIKALFDNDCTCNSLGNLSFLSMDNSKEFFYNYDNYYKEGSAPIGYVRSDLTLITEAQFNAQRNSENVADTASDQGITPISDIEKIIAANQQWYDIESIGEPCGIISDRLRELLNTIFWVISIAGIILVVILTALSFIKAIVGSDDEKFRDAFKHLFTRIIVVIILLLLPAILSFIITLINNNSTGEVTVGQDGNLYCDIVN